ncbi:hypothetical protein HDU97_009167 [Phlyctochytrium planicorne]|nr:hypothetical protein HDU97_009167 [Phlyctochytrium planicorne]
MGRNLFLITGASKGFGRAIALALAKSDIVRKHNTNILCLARSHAGLVETCEVLRTVCAQEVGNSLEIQAVEVDFSSPNLDTICSDVFDSFIPDGSYDAVFLFNNAGSLGTLDRIRNLTASLIRSALEVNVVAPVVLTAQFLTKFSSCKAVTVVNISSLAAIEPFDCWSIYGAGKAAREMFHRTMVVEEGLIQQEESSPAGSPENIQPRVRILNYAPGPLDTDMQKVIRDEMPEVPLRSIYVQMHQEGKLVDPNDSARVLVQLLESGNYENGAHVDYYDVMNPEPVGK